MMLLWVCIVRTSEHKKVLSEAEIGRQSSSKFVCSADCLLQQGVPGFGVHTCMKLSNVIHRVASRVNKAYWVTVFCRTW